MKFNLPTLKHLVIQLAKLQIYTLNLTTTFWHCKKKSHYFWTGVYIEKLERMGHISPAIALNQKHTDYRNIVVKLIMVNALGNLYYMVAVTGNAFFN